MLYCKSRLDMCYVIICGEVSEWFMEPVLKTGDPARDRGFESHPLRQIFLFILSHGDVLKW